MSRKPSEFHILNGDALKQQFPSSLEGNIIVMRECLVDGDVSGNNLNDFYQQRASFLETNYGAKKGEYAVKSASEIDKIAKLKSGDIINLWFEDDLFCQVNLWFVANLLSQHAEEAKIFLVRPNTSLQYGFGGMGAKDLKEAYSNRQVLSKEDVAVLADLWDAYKSNSLNLLSEIADNNQATLPFLSNAVDAHNSRNLTNGLPGRPEKSLTKIMKDLGTTDFVPVFREFNKREAIYGFGDLQVKRLLEKIQKE